ncbi:MAG: LysM domain-containing protein [Luteolibacter sp.]|jgi:LysM repeat protein|nr:LysM domain-containing protein [Luteolibacter sp.]
MNTTLRHLLWMGILSCSVASGQTSATSHTVRPGESLGRIARNSGCTTKELAKANNLKPNAVIHPGQRLKLPGKADAARSTETSVVEPAALVGKTHTIKAGDTYSSISRKYGVSVASLQTANPGVKATALRPGQTIQLSARKAAAPAPSTTPASKAPAVPVPAPAPGSTPAPPAVASNAMPVPAPAANAPGPQTPDTVVEKRIRTVMVDTEMTFGEFATMYGTDTARLNDLNGLDLNSATVLAKGSELYVPAQP